MTTKIPDDFPCESPLGAVTGAQPKLLVRRTDDGKYVAGPTDEECRQRYEYCLDLAQQLTMYCRRKAQEHPDWSHDVIIDRMSQGLAQKAWEWGLSSAEQAWIVEETKNIFEC